MLTTVLRTDQKSRQFKEYITRLIGYGMVNPSRVTECTQYRVTALGGGLLNKDEAHIHRFPLPFSLSGKRCWRHLAVTLSWITPINIMHQAWRCSDLRFAPPVNEEKLQVKRQEAYWKAVHRGTVQHEILEGNKAAAFIDGDHLKIQVDCRSNAGILEEAIPYALAATLEVAEETGIDIYSEVRLQVHAPQVVISATGQRSDNSGMSDGSL